MVGTLPNYLFLVIGGYNDSRHKRGQSNHTTKDASVGIVYLTICRLVLQFMQRVIVRGEMRRKGRPLYNEIKATQVASLLVKMNGGKMDFLKCIKLLYSIEREALNRWMRPVIYDDLYSLQHGQVVSQTLDRAEYRDHQAKSFWSDCLRTTSDNTIHVIKDCGIDTLSRAEIDLVKEVFENNRGKTPEQLMGEHHNHALFPEWKNPGISRIRTKYSDLLTLLGKTEEQIKEFEADLDELANLEALTR